jgi:hypothetical protein
MYLMRRPRPKRDFRDKPKVELPVPIAKTYKVGWRAYWPRFDALGKVEILAVSWDIIPASSVQKAMEIAVRRVPERIGHPGCSVGIRYVKEKASL